MRRTIFTAALLLLAATLHAAEPFAWYRAGLEVGHQQGAVTGWGNLTRIHGAPSLWKVRTPGGVKEVLRFDGHSAVWQAASAWGQLEGPRTILLYARVRGEGIICDGSTRTGADPIRVQGDGSKWETLHFSRQAGALGGFIVGADVATQNGLKCDVAEVLVFASALTEAELAAEEKRLRETWGQPEDLPAGEQYSVEALFAGLTIKPLRQSGDDGVHTYRIPGLATTVQGTLLAVFDLRHESGQDLPGNIDVGLMRSTDDGETWSPTQRVLDFADSGVGDPTILVDRETRRVFVAALRAKGNRGWNGSGPGMSADETGQFVLTHSDDDGLTWSPPISITSQVKKPEWRLCFNGPGRGLQLASGTLVLPAQFRDARGTPHSCFVSSRDHGQTWQISPPCTAVTSESQIEETKGGLLISLRDESRSGQRKWQRWNGTQWSEPWLALPDPTCQASLLRLPSGTLLFSNPAHERSRVNLTVRESRDDGQTWTAGRVIDRRLSMYSCLSQLRDGRVALLYEGVGGLNLARFWPEGTNLAAVPEGRFETTGKFGWWPARHAEKVAEPKQGVRVVFVGDSLTQGWEKAGAAEWNKRFAPLGAANYGFGGDSTQHVLWRLAHGEFEGLDPQVVVLHIGTNNARHGEFSPPQIAEGIRAVVNKLAATCPRAKIVLFAIFPRDADSQGEMRLKCAAVNALLPALADGQRIHLMNINDKFLQPDGTLSREIAPDLLHLSPAGYKIWADALAPKLQELMPEPR